MALTGYTYKQRIDIDNRGSGQTLSGCQYRIALNAANFAFANAKSDLSDLRFTGADQVTVLPYWIESIVAGVSAAAWVKLPAMPASAMGFLWMWYGNASALAVADPKSVQEPPDTGTHLYRCDETSGTSLVNAKGGAPAVVSGSFTRASDMAADTGGSILLTGGHITIPGWNGMGLEGSISFTCQPTVTMSAGGGDKRLLTKSFAGDTDFIDFYYSNAGTLVFRRSKAGVSTSVISQPLSIPSATVSHICLTWNRNWVFAFVNGIKVLSGFRYGWIPNAGASGELVLSAYGIGGVSLPVAARFDEIAIFPVQKTVTEIEALLQKRRHYQIDMRTKLTRLKESIITESFQTAVPTAEEPTLVFSGGTYSLFYTVGYSQVKIRLRRATTLEGLVAATPTDAVGQGAGGHATNAMRGNVYVESGTWYLYFAEGLGGSPNGNLFVVTSTDGINFSTRQTVLTPQAGSVQWTNNKVLKVGATYYLFVEGEDMAALVNRYQTWIFTSSSPVSGFVQFGQNPKTALQYTPNNLVSGPYPYAVNATDTLLLTHQGTLSPLYNEIFAHLAPAGFPYFEKLATRSVLGLEMWYEADQKADPCLCYDGTRTIIGTDCLDNELYGPDFISYVEFAVFAGTPQQLVQDLKHTIHAPQLAASAQPKKVVTTGNKLIFQNGKPVTLTA